MTTPTVADTGFIIPAPAAVQVPTNLRSQMPKGTLIVNNSNSNSVWVSGNGSMVSGVGQKLGPKGSMVWENDGVPVYAIADAGNVGTTNLSTSNGPQQLANPVDVGTAVALAIAAQGIPLTLLNTTVYSGTMAVTSPLLGYDCRQLASLTVRAYPANADPGKARACVVSFVWSLDAAGLQVVMIDYVELPSTNMLMQQQLTVKGPYLSIFVNGSLLPQVGLSVFGSNRLLPDQVFNVSIGGTFARTGAWANGTVYTLVNLTTGADYLMSAGGHITGRVTAPALLTGYLGIARIDKLTGNIYHSFPTLAVPAGMDSPVSFDIPPGPSLLVFYAAANVGSSQLQFDYVQTG